MPKLILIRGVPGSGKSTLAKELMAKNGNLWNIEADMYFNRPDGIYDWNPKLLKNAHEWCYKTTENWLTVFNRSVVVSNTFIRKWEMARYVALALKHDLDLTILICEGNYTNVHGVPPEKVEQMRQNFER